MDDLKRKEERARKLLDALNEFPAEMSTRIENAIIDAAWLNRLMKEGRKEKTA